MRLSPALLVFGILFVIAEVYKFTHGEMLWGSIDLALALIFVIVAVLATRVTPPREPAVARGRWLPLQLAACVAIIVITALGLWQIPGWTSDFKLGVNNFVIDCIPIAIALSVLGVPLRDMGLQRFQKGSAWIAFALLILPLGVFGWFLGIGKVSLALVLRTWGHAALQNGFSEEFLWRGAILSRFRAVMRTEYAILAQALLFGLWHFHYDMTSYHGDAVATVADMIASQGLWGMAAGYLTLKTGNIAIPSAFHLLFDSLQIFQ